MTPRWKIRRGTLPSRYWPTRIRTSPMWLVYLDDKPEPVGAFYVWENAITHVDTWFSDQTLRGA